MNERTNDTVEVSLNVGLSFIEDSIIDEHAVPETAVRDIAGGHFVLIRVYHTVLAGIISAAVPRSLRLLLLVILGILRFLLARSAIRILLLLVRFDVKVAEQEVEHHGVHADPQDEGLRIIAFDEEQLEGVDHHDKELDHLQGRQISLPP